jgi:hypothetical protein
MTKKRQEFKDEGQEKKVVKRGTKGEGLQTMRLERSKTRIAKRGTRKEGRRRKGLERRGKEL